MHSAATPRRGSRGPDPIQAHRGRPAKPASRRCVSQPHLLWASDAPSGQMPRSVRNCGREPLRIARPVSLPLLSASAGRGSAGMGHQPRRSADRPCTRSGVPVAAVDVWSYRDLPGRPRNVASQPAPKRLHCGRTPNSFSRPTPNQRFEAENSDPERELQNRGDQDHREQRHQDEAGPRPHRRVSPRPSRTGTAGSSGAPPPDPSTATVTALPARTPSSAAAERRSSASVHIP